MAKSASQGPASALRLYDALVAGHPEVERKGASMPYTSSNGHMFSFLDATGTMALALSAEQQEAFLTRYKTRVAEQHGRLMKDFVVVPERLLKRTTELQEWFDASCAWTASRKPKPTTRPVKKKS